VAGMDGWTVKAEALPLLLLTMTMERPEVRPVVWERPRHGQDKTGGEPVRACRWLLGCPGPRFDSIGRHWWVSHGDGGWGGSFISAPTAGCESHTDKGEFTRPSASGLPCTEPEPSG